MNGIDVTSLASQLLPGIADIVVTVLFGVALWLAKELKAKWNLDAEADVRRIEAAHRDALHSAVETALGAAIHKFDGKLVLTPGSQQAAFIIQLVEASVPVAVRVLGATEAWILHAAQSKLELGPKAMAAITPETVVVTK